MCSVRILNLHSTGGRGDLYPGLSRFCPVREDALRSPAALGSRWSESHVKLEQPHDDEDDEDRQNCDNESAFNGHDATPSLRDIACIDLALYCFA